MLYARFAEILTKDRAPGQPLLLVLAGHNGAGKTTYFELRIKNLLGDVADNHINPDEIEQNIRNGEELPLTDEEFSRNARVMADEERERLLRAGDDFSFETVFSHKSKLEFLERARKTGYFVVVLFIVLDTPERSWERVQFRVSNGGHSVPYDKVISRYPRVLENLQKSISMAHLLIVVDNSEDYLSEPYKEVALYQNGALVEGTHF